MRKVVYLVRHAQYDNPLQILVGRLPVKLSETGKKEAEKLRTYFADKNISKIYSSAVERCKQTSQIISDNHLPIEYDKRILETHSSFQGYWELDWQHFFSYIDQLGGESPEDIYTRVADFWDTVIASDSNEENVLVCSHGDPLYLLYVYVAKKEIPDTIGIYNIPIDEYQPKASVRKIVIEDGNVSIEPILAIDAI